MLHFGSEVFWDSLQWYHNIFLSQILDFSVIFIFSSFGQMIRPIIDSISVRPSGGTSVSGLATSSRGPDTIFEPRDTPSAQTGLRDQPDGWWVLIQNSVHSNGKILVPWWKKYLSKFLFLTFFKERLCVSAHVYKSLAWSVFTCVIFCYLLLVMFAPWRWDCSSVHPRFYLTKKQCFFFI